MWHLHPNSAVNLPSFKQLNEQAHQEWLVNLWLKHNPQLRARLEFVRWLVQEGKLSG